MTDMLCKAGAHLYGLPNLCKRSEKFKDSDEDDTDLELLGVGIFSIIGFIIFAPWYIAMFILWIRLVMNAFKCSKIEGMTSIFFYPLYKIWKFGSLIETSCKGGNNLF